MQSSSIRTAVGALVGDLWKSVRSILFPYSRAEIVEGVRNAWTQGDSLFGRESKEARDLHDLTQDECESIDDKTWLDLELPLVFAELDFTATDIGQQFLYRKMRQLVGDENRLRTEHRVVECLQTDAAARESILVRLYPMSSSDLSAATKLLYGNVVKPWYSKHLVIAWAAGMLALISATWVLGAWMWYVAVPVLALNFVACQVFASRTDHLSYGYHVLYQMLCVADAMSRNRSAQHVPACAELAAIRPQIIALKRRSFLLAFSQSSPNLLIAQPMHLVNLLTAIEPLLHTYNANRLDNGGDTLRTVYELLGSLEAMIAIARYKERHPANCNPRFVREGAIALQSAYHPLIPDPVANDFDTNGGSAMITGSNMAGKTSFIKTVGLNLVLARTIWLCHAESASFPLLGVATSIKTVDGIVEGRSFYFAELERVLTFLEEGQNGGTRKLLLIDEIYRGTNTVERIAGAAAVLQALSAAHTVLVTTHDIELSTYLSDRFAMFFFDETGNLESPFDYRLKAGVCKTRNALKLMGKLGYQDGIVSRAREIAEELDAARLP